MIYFVYFSITATVGLSRSNNSTEAALLLPFFFLIALAFGCALMGKQRRLAKICRLLSLLLLGLDVLIYIVIALMIKFTESFFPCELNGPSYNEWTFGQVLPVCMLMGPLVWALEAWFEHLVSLLLRHCYRILDLRV